MTDDLSSELPEPDEGLAAELWHIGRIWMTEWSRAQQQPPPVIYHYTDAVGLLGIVRSKEIWASHAAFLNDSSEVVYIKRVLKTVTTALKARYDESRVCEFLEFVEMWFTDRILSDYEVFLACFCEDGVNSASGVAIRQLVAATRSASRLRSL
jgi:hypothetical protein